MKQFRVILFVILLSLVLSCERRDLTVPDFSTKIDVRVSVNMISNVTCDVYNPKIQIPRIEPEVFRVMFFDLENDKMLGESFISDKSSSGSGETIISGNVSILPGDYRLLMYSFGTESSLIDKYDSWEYCKVYTDPLSDEALKAMALRGPENGQAIHYQPDHLVAARSERESIPWHSGSHVISVDATSVVESYYLQVKVTGLEYVSTARAVLSSMAHSVTLASVEQDFESPVSLYIPLQKSDDNDVPVVCNVFNTFGRIPDSVNDLEVTFDLKTVDGRTITKEFDISDLFLSEDCINHHWLLVEETIVVPPPPDPGPGNSSGGFDPVVNDWENENHEIHM